MLLALALLAAAPDYWEQGQPRSFVVLQPALGAGYVQLAAQAGWGRPMWMWGGAEAIGFVAPTFATGYAGVRLDLLAIEVRAGARRTVSFSHGPLPQGPSHSIDDFNAAQPRTAYTTLEAEIDGFVPLPFGYGFWDFEGYRIQGAPAGADIYEEWMKVAARPPAVGAARGGYLLALGRDEWLKLGVLADFTATFGRGTLVRAGPLLVARFTDHLDLVVLAAPAVRTPDSLGFFGGMYGTARVRWTWATGEKESLRL